MEHLPIYRSSTRRTGATLLQWRRTASWGAAAAALTLSGIALGYQGFSEPSTDQSSVVVAGVTVPAPMVTLPLSNGGHPDIITALSSALIAHIQAAPPAVQQLLFGPLGPLLGPQPIAMTVEPVDFSAVDEPLPVVLDEMPDEMPVDIPVEEDAVVEPIFTPVLAAPPALRTLSFATVAIAAPDEEPQQVESAVEAAPPPPPAPAETKPAVAPAKPQTAAAQVAPPPVARPQFAQPVQAAPAPAREKPNQEAKRPVPTPVVERKNGNGNGNGNDKGGKGNKGDSSNHDD